MLLAIDTSAGTSVAVVDRDGGILSERTVADTRSHAEVIGRLIRETLEEADVAPAALSGVVAGMGPGPFTGLRVGIAAARAFAFGVGKPVVPLVSHDAVAFARALAGDAEPLLVVTDARRRELYWSRYGAPDAQGFPTRVGGPALAKPDELPAGVRRVDAPVIPAGSLGLLAEALYAARRPFAAQSGGHDEPLYLRSPDVTPSAGPKRVS
ncbi:tRNA (adenosine(37)-N6)-threonylcarbamoyltransferase complex dimerization subunit type 1 TsaB [Galbitalea sp. SE-J8]|uniref:tRNA (adenosine(37)-N6)-threonylcarbamoyltransferase complex dimerization subunit type 1 TsaB n=1 Tax=Galbitalea sp. SE-J8 TaxID=3054952 RepID=UPI00259CC6E8|nr:tRNA (adenosine(37)-N6)-threonylcarbamoyltransferase complex dimerization subunit type 1 TsaB [Galbitalea sp. SE-J8]MDM4761447.1 tRNA (adenosine(37)-N6)-threonylcarbamoyltransferase complex dimerization subunit type 1 TsaB [Galbitalea sp. SE-J8]